MMGPSWICLRFPSLVLDRLPGGLHVLPHALEGLTGGQSEKREEKRGGKADHVVAPVLG